MQLLLAEDDDILADGLSAQLGGAGFTVEHAPNGAVAEYLLRKSEFDIAIIDLGMPLVDGFSVLNTIRETRPTLPVVILTALDKLDSRIASLNAGADDYVTKPFNFYELEARLHAVLRRAKQNTVNPGLRLGSVYFDRLTRRATIGGQAVELSPREATLLELLLMQPGKVVTKASIAEAWTMDVDDPNAANNAEVHIHRLRRKLDGSDVAIRTARGVGYLIKLDTAPGG